jgi:hypothetical protein
MKTFFIAFLVLFMATACSSPKSTTTENGQGLRLVKAPASPAFPDASIELVKYAVDPAGDVFKVDFEWEVKNYDLGAQTSDAITRGIANSKDGQHIHYIVNGGPYDAHYMPGMSDELPAGNYVVLAFLSRSYHESVKNPNAYHILNLTLGEVDPSPVDLTTPHLFYSRPKGSYAGADTEKLLLDFYLINTTLSKEGNNVRATINGQEFLIDEWAPYYIQGLPKGEVTIKLELLDSKGKLIPGPFNSVERTVTLTE